MSSEIQPSEEVERSQFLAAILGSIPATFSTNIRTLVSPSPKSEGGGAFALRRMLKVRSVRSVVCNAARTLYWQEFGEEQEITDADIKRLFTRQDIAALVALMFLNKKVSSLTKANSWIELTREMLLRSEIGAQVGIAIPSIGAGVGMLCGGLRFFGMATLLIADEKEFIRYFRVLRKSDEWYSTSKEKEIWGTNHIGVSSAIMTNLGFGMPHSAAIRFGLEPSTGVNYEKEDDYYRWYIANVWLTTMLKTGEEPDIRHRGDYYPKGDAQGRLVEAVARARGSTSAINWLEPSAVDDIEKQLEDAGDD